MEILISIVEPFEVLTLDLEWESFMFLQIPILNFIELIQLPLEYVELSTFFSIQIQELLILLQSVDNFIELRLI